MARLSVLLTGATGYIAAQLLPALRERYELRLTDVRREDGSGEPVEGVEGADLLSESRESLTEMFSDIDVVVHCGFHRPTGADVQSEYDGQR
ncbi:MAG: NAD-dependent epimerase/dehydratase family protein, partial [Actinomycetota bacterium]